MTILTLDFETYFDKDYTLRKLTTEAYIRDPRFQLLCTGIKENEERAKCYRAGETIMCNAIPASGVLCHHAHFDGFIMSHHLGLRPAFWFDTLSMARCAFPHDKSHSLQALAQKFDLGVKTVPYEEFKGKRAHEMDEELWAKLMDGCCDDVELTHKVFKKLLPLVPKEELKIIDMTVRMFTEPLLRLDEPRAKKYLEELQVKQAALLERLGVDKTDLASANKFADLLRGYGIEPPTKISPSTGKETYAFAKTDMAWQDLANDIGNEEVSLLVEARLSAKSTLGETRAGRLIGMSERGNLPVYLKYYGAHTGRWSGGDKMNFQNFQRGGELRKSLLAPEGFVLCVADLSQIECRILNWLAGEEWVLEAFRMRRDLYCEMASKVYCRTITKADKLERFLGKTLVLGAGFGIGWKKLQRLLKMNKIDLDDYEARSAIETYRGGHPNVVALWNTMDWCLDWMLKAPLHTGRQFKHEFGGGAVKIDGKRVILPNGAVLDYSGLARAEDGKGISLVTGRGTTNMYGGKFTENIVQALARVVMAEAMIKIGGIYKIITTTHDEIVYLVPEEEAEIGMELGLNILKTPPVWASDLPLDAEGGYDVRYSK
jgi:DNA polymerase